MTEHPPIDDDTALRYARMARTPAENRELMHYLGWPSEMPWGDQLVDQVYDIIIGKRVSAALQQAAGKIAGSFPYNGELRPDGTTDPHAGAYVEGLHDAHAIVLNESGGHPAGKSEGQAVTPVWTAPTKLPLDAAPSAETARKTLWAVQRPDGVVLTRTLSMVGDGHAWSEQEAREFVASPAFRDWTVLRREQVTTWTAWVPVTSPGVSDGGDR